MIFLQITSYHACGHCLVVQIHQYWHQFRELDPPNIPHPCLANAPFVSSHSTPGHVWVVVVVVVVVHPLGNHASSYHQPLFLLVKFSQKKGS
jgi:hypothetical protein